MGDLASARINMVDGQILTNDVQDPHVLQAMRTVLREKFLPASDAARAYADVETPLEGGRAILMPLTFARLLQLAEVGTGDLVLDIGCATGYSAAVLAELADSVVALESDADLAAQATETLSALDVDNVAVVQGPLSKGYAAEAPYDVIFVNGSVEEVPQDLTAQLAPGGRLVVIIGTGRVGRATVLTKTGKKTGQREAFDAAAAALPDFRRDAAFSF